MSAFGSQPTTITLLFASASPATVFCDVVVKKVWEVDLLRCPKCSREMRIVALIDERAVIERILRNLGLWEEGVRLNPARAPPNGEGKVELIPGDPFPDCSMEPVMDYDLCANG